MIASNERRTFGILTIVTAVVLATLGSPAGAAEPAAGQSLSSFQDAVREQLATSGDRMGYGLERCALRPGFAISGVTYLGRAFSQRPDTEIVLVAVEDGRVTRWEEFDLPRLDGWITHQTTRCKGSTLKIGDGRFVQRYRWDGRAFTRVSR